MVTEMLSSCPCIVVFCSAVLFLDFFFIIAYFDNLISNQQASRLVHSSRSRWEHTNRRAYVTIIIE